MIPVNIGDAVVYQESFIATKAFGDVNEAIQEWRTKMMTSKSHHTKADTSIDKIKTAAHRVAEKYGHVEAIKNAFTEFAAALDEEPPKAGTIDTHGSSRKGGDFA